MKTKIYHGNINLYEFAEALANYFDRGPLFSKWTKTGDQAYLQISTRPDHSSGGSTSIGVSVKQVDDRIEVQVGEQSLFGVAASLGKSALMALRNPLTLLGRLDDIAQDIEHLELDEQVWTVIEQIASNADASMELTDRLKRHICEYCRVANPISEGRCLACGAPLGDSIPFGCTNCGYAVLESDGECPNCGQPV